MVASKRVRIGFIGVGKMGQCAHLCNYASLDDCEVMAIADLKPELARRVAARYKVPRVYSNPAELLAGEELDALVAAQPFTRHQTFITQIAKSGLPIFIEKPLARSVEAGEAILEVLADTGSSLMVGYHKRSDPATVCAKGEIDKFKASGELGRLTYIRITMPFGNWVGKGFDCLIETAEAMPGLPEDPPDSTMDEDIARQYEKFINYYIHQVNLLRHLLGEPYRVTYADPSGIILAAESSSGVACVIELSPYKTTAGWQESALVAFEDGYVKLELPAPLVRGEAGRVEVFKDPGGGAEPETLYPGIPQVDAMRRQAMNFINFVRGKACSGYNNPSVCTAKAALEDLRTAREYIRLLNSIPFPLA